MNLFDVYSLSLQFDPCFTALIRPIYDLYCSTPLGGKHGDWAPPYFDPMSALRLKVQSRMWTYYTLSVKCCLLILSVQVTPSDVTRVWRPMKTTATDRAPLPALSTPMPAPPLQDLVSEHTSMAAWFDLDCDASTRGYPYTVLAWGLLWQRWIF